MAHSIFLIGDQNALTEQQWYSVYDLIRLHASHMYQEGLGHAERHIADNHHLQIGMALIMLGVLFPAFGHSEEYIETGRQIVSDNLEYSIYADGVNNEDSMTYSHFIARLYLEAELLLTKNGLTGVPNCAEKIQKQYEFLFLRFPSEILTGWMLWKISRLSTASTHSHSQEKRKVLCLKAVAWLSFGILDLMSTLMPWI